MSKIRSNVRGDSGLSDSQVVRSQKFFIQKSKEALDNMEKDSIMEMNRRRFQANAISQSKKQSVWNKIKEWLGVN